MHKLTKEIEPYIDALFPIIYINTYEELTVNDVVLELKKDKELYRWDSLDDKFSTLDKFLEIIKDEIISDKEHLIILKNAHSFLTEPKVIALLKEIAHLILENEKVYANIIIISPTLNIPIELEKLISIFEVSLPDIEEIEDIIIAYEKAYADELPPKDRTLLATSLKGLSHTEIRKILDLSIYKFDKMSLDCKDLILIEKRQTIKKSGVLEMIELKERVEDIGGLENLKHWLSKKAQVVTRIEEAKAFGVDTPKGVFIVGMPGCGKSLTAKATAQLFEVPLLRLDIGRLMGKYVGESEANMRKAINQAEAISPCVLWIDEIEKAFSGISSGNEVTSRLFGNFLTWMQEKTSDVYVVATANDISNLPAELLRKGRFDEVFFVDLPSITEREKIFEVHINKRKNSISVELDTLAKETEGYSGADIETIVKDVLEEAFIQNKSEITIDMFISSIKNTASISKTLKEKIDEYKKKFEKYNLKKASFEE